MQLYSPRGRDGLNAVYAGLLFVLTLVLTLALLPPTAGAATAGRISIAVPKSSAALSGSVTLSAKLPSRRVKQLHYRIDGRSVRLRDARRGRIVRPVLETSTLSDGTHTLSITGSYRKRGRRVTARGTRLLRTANSTEASASARWRRDRQAPSAPGQLRISGITQSGAMLGWAASSDNVGVTGYDIYVSGKWSNWTAATSFALTGLDCGRSYSVQIVALDAARNYAAGAPVSFTTTACAPPPAPAGDATPPSAPTGLAFSAVTETGATLSWDPASDNVGVASYDINVDGKWFDWSLQTSHTIAGLTCAKTYSVYIVALDAARNYSAGQPVSLRTAACASDPGGQPPTTPPPPPPGVPGQPSGTPVPSANLPGWKLIFADDFTKDAALGTMGSDTDAGKVVYTGATGTRWVTYPKTYLDTYQRRPYRSDKVLSVHDGVLDFYLHPVDGQPAGANPSPVITGTSQYQTFGRYSARVKVDDKDLSEYYMAWLLWPQNESAWQSAESDYPEGQLRPGRTGVSGFAHYGAGKVESFHDAATDLHQWHTITQDWTPLVRRYYVDEKLIFTTINPVYQQPERWQLQTETNTWNVTDPSHEGHLLVDWVAVYGYTPGT